MNELKIYLSFNPSLKGKDLRSIKVEYLKDKESGNRVTSIDSFLAKYPTFDLNFYKKFNPEIANYSTYDTFIHFNTIGINNNMVIYSIESFYKNYPSFNGNPTLIDMYNYHNQIINEKKFHLSIMNDNLFKKIDLIFNQTNEQNMFNISHNIRIAHIFVHFFKIGGGEAYLQNFNENSPFEETLFINNNYDNETLFNFNGKTVEYETYEKLNQYLLAENYDLIIDHQLYWFDKKYSHISFLNIPQNRVIRITHGVPIHHQNISDLNYYYSIELYNDVKADESWNNHIKIYNNIGVDIQDNINEISVDLNNINIAIIGRINEEKVPINFIKILIEFVQIYPQYIFNFYGLIDKSYSNFFLNKINKNNKCSKNIFYHGIIDPPNIKDIYLNNNILIHPSKLEAGATVILEAMSFGLPVIARNAGGIPHALGDTTFLCTTDKEIFDKLLTINNDNYIEISKKNMLKIENENNKSKLLPELYQELCMIHYLNSFGENNDFIPNIIHYVYGLKKQTEEFPFVYYISILSNIIINKPLVIYFHYQYLPYGYWWDKIKKYIKLNYINATNLYWGNKKITKYAHKSDKIRLEMLYKYGGIYMDIDTISYRPYSHLLNNDFIIGMQEENYGEDKINLYCNAILFAKRENFFIKRWIEKYESYFNPDGWCEASIHLPHFLIELLNENEIEKIKILPKEAFYYPLYNETDKIFEKDDEEIHPELIVLHYWNTFSHKYYDDIYGFGYIKNNNSLYSKLLKNLFDIINTNTNTQKY